MRYTVTIEPNHGEDDLDLLPDFAGGSPSPGRQRVAATIDAADKDEALTRAEAAYRRMYPQVGKLRITVVRLRPPR